MIDDRFYSFPLISRQSLVAVIGALLVFCYEFMYLLPCIFFYVEVGWKAILMFSYA